MPLRMNFVNVQYAACSMRYAEVYCCMQNFSMKYICEVSCGYYIVAKGTMVDEYLYVQYIEHLLDVQYTKHTDLVDLHLSTQTQLCLKEYEVDNPGKDAAGGVLVHPYHSLSRK